MSVKFLPQRKRIGGNKWKGSGEQMTSLGFKFLNSFAGFFGDGNKVLDRLRLNSLSSKSSFKRRVRKNFFKRAVKRFGDGRVFKSPAGFKSGNQRDRGQKRQ